MQGDNEIGTNRHQYLFFKLWRLQNLIKDFFQTWKEMYKHFKQGISLKVVFFFKRSCIFPITLSSLVFLHIIELQAMSWSMILMLKLRGREWEVKNKAKIQFHKPYTNTSNPTICKNTIRSIKLGFLVDSLEFSFSKVRLGFFTLVIYANAIDVTDVNVMKIIHINVHP